MTKRSLVINGRKTSVSLEDAFWYAFRAAARARRIKLTDLAAEIDARRGDVSLSRAIRAYVFVIAQKHRRQAETDLVFARRLSALAPADRPADPGPTTSLVPSRPDRQDFIADAPRER